MLLATCFTIALCSSSLIGAQSGLGTHIWLLAAETPDLTPSFLVKGKHITQSIYISYLTYVTAISLAKASIITSYARLFPFLRFRLFMVCTGFLVLINWLTIISIIIFECVPVSPAWYWTETRSILPFLLASSSVNMIIDLMIWFAPLPVLWGMDMKRRDRAMFCGLFVVGFLFVPPSSPHSQSNFPTTKPTNTPQPSNLCLPPRNPTPRPRLNRHHILVRPRPDLVDRRRLHRYHLRLDDLLESPRFGSIPRFDFHRPSPWPG